MRRSRKRCCQDVQVPKAIGEKLATRTLSQVNSKDGDWYSEARAQGGLHVSRQERACMTVDEI